MPGLTRSLVGKPNRFVVLAPGGRFTLTDLCEQFAISRQTAFEFLGNCAANGLAG
jgi:DNA-binding GntR family transcriptional regulator